MNGLRSIKIERTLRAMKNQWNLRRIDIEWIEKNKEMDFGSNKNTMEFERNENWRIKIEQIFKGIIIEWNLRGLIMGQNGIVGYNGRR